MKLTAALREEARRGRLDTPDALRAALRERIIELLAVHDSAMSAGPKGGPLVVLVVGINGGGKTTTIGKLAARYKREGKRVLLGAGDTFRAGAIQQLRIWAEERAGVDIVAHEEGADAAAVLFDTIRAAKSRGHDVVLCDTAGRLQSQGPLMDELTKVGRVLGKARDGAPDEVLLVLDATIGQNALSQARLFGEAVGVTGIVLTKLDGTAKGGVVIAVSEEMGLPVKFVGVGEQVDDLRPFDAEAFATALLADPDEIASLESA
jgi:fused signal recognition particle receptor